jgi:hypothetical protein
VRVILVSREQTKRVDLPLRSVPIDDFEEVTMLEKDPGTPETFPVFAIAPPGSVQRGAHPDYKGPLPSDDQESLVQVGMARRRPDGSYFIQLATVPISGQLLLRLEKEYHASSKVKE